jgi:glucose/arabinose dehydrogenase
MLITERPGRVRLIDTAGQLQPDPVATIQNARGVGEGGLLGIELHPDFAENNYVYLYYTFSSSGTGTMNRVVRMTYTNNQLTNEQTIVDSIPGAFNHNGGRIKFGPDGYLYITTGDAQDPSTSQNRNSLAGKILRVTDEGLPAPGNPFNNPVYSYGHRNAQGLVWDGNNNLWSTEHGRSGALSGLDEINLINMGSNYGWPEIQGDETNEGMIEPVKHSGGSTWAPASAAYLNGSLFFGGLRGETLYEAILEGNNVTQIKEHFKGEFGRIRDVVVGPGNTLYFSTSNRDGRGNPVDADDRIIKVNPIRI